MKKTLIIGHVWPEPTTTAAGKRMLQLIEAFLEFGHEITFGSTALSSEFSLDLQTMGVTPAQLQLNHTSFDDFILDLKPNFVVFDRFMTEEQFGWRVAEHEPKAIRILNTEDLHSLRKSREECFKKGEEFSTIHWKNHPMTLRELASIYRSDFTLMISSFEMQLLTKEANLPQNLLVHLPFMVETPTKDQITAWPSFEERRNFISVGNGKHVPNVEAIKTLRKTVWPMIRKALPKAKLYILGAYLPQQVLEMHNPQEGFEVHGWVEDLNVKLQNTRLLLAPIQFGAGIKGKLMDSMLNGIPSVTTSIGAEGMHGELPWPGAIRDDWQDFAQAAINLYQDPKKWESAQKKGISILKAQFQMDAQHDKLKHRLTALQQHLQQHRTNNLMGRMLQQQGLAATKYMAKWIEEKTRK